MGSQKTHPPLLEAKPGLDKGCVHAFSHFRPPNENLPLADHPPPPPLVLTLAYVGVTLDVTLDVTWALVWMFSLSSID